MVSMRRMTQGVAVVLAANVLLAGCTASDDSPKPTGEPGTSTSTQSESPTPTGSGTPGPPADQQSQIRAAITQIAVRPEMLQLKDKNGVELGSISYDDTADKFVDLFTHLIGAAPTVTDTPGGHEWSPVTHYEWDGFELLDDHEEGDYEADMNVSVMFTEPELGPRRITVSTIQGFKPGDDLRWLATYMDEPFDEDFEFHQIQAEHGPPIGEQMQGYVYSNSNSVTGQTARTGDRSVIFAPWNFGIGHV
jgi:hypothetical protein